MLLLQSIVNANLQVVVTSVPTSGLSMCKVKKQTNLDASMKACFLCSVRVCNTHKKLIQPYIPLCDNLNADDYLLSTVIIMANVIDLTMYCVCILTDLTPII